MLNSTSWSQRGFSLVEMIVGMVVAAILATAFLAAFSSVLKTSASPLQSIVMEDLAASRMDELLSGSFQSALAATGTAYIVDGTNYWVNVTSQPSVVSGVGVAVASGVHLTVTVNTALCASCVALSGDTFNVP